MQYGVKCVFYGFLLPLLALLLGGCSVKTKMAEIDTVINLPQTFSVEGKEVVSATWWRDFGDPDLVEIIEQGLGANLNIKEAYQRLKQAEALEKRAQSSLLPELDLQAGASESRRMANDNETSTTSLSLALAASYELDLWGRLEAGAEASAFDRVRSEADLQTAALSIAAQIATAWYQLGESNRQEELLQEQQEVNKVGLQLIQLRFNAGQIGIADVLQQRQLIESKSGELAQQRATSAILEHRLAILSGRAPGQNYLSKRPQLTTLPSLPQLGVPLSLINRRPDLQGAYFRILAADRRLAAAIAERYPRINLTADASTSGSASELFDNWLLSLAANMLAPLFDGGARKSEVERNEALVRENLYRYGQATLEAIGEVEDALRQEQEQRRLIESLSVQLKLATKTLVNVRDRYKLGAEDYQRVLSALLSQQSLQRNLLRAREQEIEFRIGLYRALGGEVPIEMMTVEIPES